MFRKLSLFSATVLGVLALSTTSQTRCEAQKAKDLLVVSGTVTPEAPSPLTVLNPLSGVYLTDRPVYRVQVTKNLSSGAITGRPNFSDSAWNQVTATWAKVGPVSSVVTKDPVTGVVLSTTTTAKFYFPVMFVGPSDTATVTIIQIKNAAGAVMSSKVDLTITDWSGKYLRLHRNGSFDDGSQVDLYP